MDYRSNKQIVTVKPHNPNVRVTNSMKPGLRLRVLDANHTNRNGQRCYLVQKETADHPMMGLFSVLPSEVEFAA